MGVLGRRTHVIYAAPGCGKTTTLVDRLKDAVAAGAHYKDIMFTSLTRVACILAAEKAIEELDGSVFAQEFNVKDSYFKTLHAICYMELRSKGGVMNNKHRKEFYDLHGYLMNSIRHEVTDDIPRTSQCSEYEKYNMRRVLCEPVLEDPDLPTYVEFVKLYEDFKKKKGVFDFTDLLCRFVENDKPLPIDTAFIDEAQDLCPLQVKVLEVACRDCDNVYVALDDDQAIFDWAGADSSWGVSLQHSADTVDIRPVSYRLKSEIHRLANDIITRVKSRVAKDYSPHSVGGWVTYVPDEYIHEVIGSFKGGENIMVVCRHESRNWVYHGMFRSLGILSYVSGDRRGVDDPDVRQAVSTAHRLRSGLGVKASELVSFFGEYVRVKPNPGVWLVKRGTISRLRESPNTMVTLDMLVDRYKGSLFRDLIMDSKISPLITRLHYRRSPSIRENSMDAADILWRERIGISKPGDSIRISTIHAAKGLESDIVIWDNCLMGSAMNSLVRGWDAEHRIAYVAATRAIDRLIIVHGKDFGYYPTMSLGRSWDKTVLRAAGVE